MKKIMFVPEVVVYPCMRWLSSVANKSVQRLW